MHAGDLYHRLKYQLDDVGTDVNQLRGEMELGAKGLLEELLAADQCFAQEEFDEAESAYQELRDQCDAYAVPWLESKLALVQFERSMVKGEWTPIKFDPILGLWDQRTGEWEADKEGRLVAQGRKSRGWWRIVHRGSVGADFEMRTKVRFESHDPFAFRLGPVVGCRCQLDRFGRPKPEKADWISCVWSRNKKGKSSTLLLNRYHLGNLRPQPVQVPATEITELKVHAVDGKITFYINGVPVITDQALTPLNKEKPIKLLSGDGVGFFIHFMATDPKVIFEDAEVRRL